MWRGRLAVWCCVWIIRLLAGVTADNRKEWAGDDNAAYLFVSAKLSFDGAEEFCENNGGHLTSVTSNDHRSWFRDQIENEETRWVGLRRSGSCQSTVGCAGEFEWVDEYSHTEAIRWKEGEPSKTKPCAYLNSNAKAVSDQCSSEHRFICRVLKNPCESNPCQNGGSCSGSLGDFSCACSTGFVGPHCEIDVNECDVDAVECLNGGTCVDGQGAAICRCPPGWNGQYCQHDTDECEDSSPCVKGRCENTNGSFLCLCEDQYAGQLCDIALLSGDGENKNDVPVWYYYAGGGGLFLAVVIIIAIVVVTKRRQISEIYGTYRLKRKSGKSSKKPPTTTNIKSHKRSSTPNTYGDMKGCISKGTDEEAEYARPPVPPKPVDDVYEEYELPDVSDRSAVDIEALRKTRQAAQIENMDEEFYANTESIKIEKKLKSVNKPAMPAPRYDIAEDTENGDGATGRSFGDAQQYVEPSRRNQTNPAEDDYVDADEEEMEDSYTIMDDSSSATESRATDASCGKFEAVYANYEYGTHNETE